MAILKVEQFGGMIPKLDEKKLPSNCAVDAINVDLQGGHIKPVYAPLAVYAESYYVNQQIGSIAQRPTACYELVGGAAGGYALFSLPAGRHTVASDDYLWYSVFLPDAVAAAGQGCLGTVQFSDATTIAAGTLDQNGLNWSTGDLGTYARGKWYVRRIRIGGILDSGGASTTGKTLAYISFKTTANVRACFGVAYIGASTSIVGAPPRCTIFDPDLQQDPLIGEMTAASGRQTVIDDDQSLYVGIGATLNYAIAPAGLGGGARQKAIFVPINGALKISTAPIQTIRAVGLSTRDRFYGLAAHSTQFVNPAYQYNWSYGGYPDINSLLFNALGWCAVGAPMAAPTCNVTGGAGSDITRAYVYTHVSEDGLESGPSPALTKTGKEDGTWTLTVPTWSGTSDYLIGTAAPSAWATATAYTYGDLRISDSQEYRCVYPHTSAATFAEDLALGYWVESFGIRAYKRRLYRTTAGGSEYQYLGVMDYNDTTFVDGVADASLGEDLPTSDYVDIPRLDYVSTWINGLIGGPVNGTQIAFCEPYQYHAWPDAYRYTVPHFIVATGTVGDKFVVLTKGKPLFYTGSAPESLNPTELQSGEACLGPNAVLTTDVGVIYPGKTGWGLIDYSGYQNITKEFLSSTGYGDLVSESTIAAFDNRKLYWITRGGTTGYAFEFGAQEKSLTKWEIPTTVIATVQAMSYYGPRNTLWGVGFNGSSYPTAVKLFGDTSQKLKWTWKSKLLRTARPVSFSVAQVESTEWDSLSVEMANREVYMKGLAVAWATATDYVVNDMRTNGGNTYRCLVAHTSGTFATDLAAAKWILNNSVYTITITGLTQSEAWCYLKVWADADKSTNKVLVFDDFVASDAPVVLAGGISSDCWQFELRGNMAVSAIALAETERELNEE